MSDTAYTYDSNFQAAMERLTAANRKAANDYVDLVERAVVQVTDLQLKTAGALKVPAVSGVVETQVDVARGLAGTYVETARELINA